MMTHYERTHRVAAKANLKTVAVVSRHPHEHVLETVLGAMDHDIVFVESVGNAYSHIKRLSPDLIIVCLTADDQAGCQVLSMLKLDSETSRIPVVTYAAMWPEDFGSASDEDADDEPVFALSMN
jgi:CheY-like chemotaxis protein